VTTPGAPDSCSNGQNDYPKAWDKLPAQQQGGVFFNTAEDCCETYWNGPCVMTDYCKNSNDGPEDEPKNEPADPEDEPEDKPADPKDEPEDKPADPKDEPVNENCEAHKFWHPVTTDSTVDACSNGLDDYPLAWDRLLPQQQVGIFFDSADDCCKKYWKKDCVKTDVCEGSVSEPSSSDPSTDKPIGDTEDPSTDDEGGDEPSVLVHDCRLWHPVTTSDTNICSNAKDDYPESWKKLPAEQRGDVFFPSAVDCCIMYWKGPCEHVDQCEDEHADNKDPILDDEDDDDDDDDQKPSNPPTSSLTWDTSACGRWHPTGEVRECSNGKDDYNKVWDMLPESQRDLLFFDDPQECCRSHFGDSCISIADQCKPPEPTMKPTNKPIIVNDGETAITAGKDDFDDPAAGFPWKIEGDPPEWSVIDGMMVNAAVDADGPRKKSVLALKTSLAFNARFRCNVKVDTMMPFDWFALKINGKVKYPYYSSSNGQWTVFGSNISPGENLVELVVEAGPLKPAHSRNSGLGYGSGHVWLNSCAIEPA
jgi:hypothetical protein